MDIQLKGLYVSEKMSEETTAFKANLYINNIKAGYADNDGRGGMTFYHSEGEKGKRLIAEAEEWCKKLPPKVLDGFEGNDKYTLPMNLEHFIDDLVADHLDQKYKMQFQRKMEKVMANGILVGIPDKEYRAWSFKVPLAMVLQSPAGIKSVRKLIQEKIIPNMKEEEKFLNTNIPQSMYQAVGIDPNRIVERQKLDDQKKAQPDQSEDRSQHSRQRR
jgi:hypothetical protein